MNPSPTQRRIVRMLKIASLSVTHLARALGLTDNAIRCALTKLERQGLVFRTAMFRFVTGRTVAVFHLTRTGHDLAKEMTL
jgi:predicted ArsR family transcriptional regulator